MERGNNETNHGGRITSAPLTINVNEIFRLKAAGVRHREIAQRVGCNLSTVTYHLLASTRLARCTEVRGDRDAPPAPAELAATLAALRQAEFARLAAQPVEQTKAERRRQRMCDLHPLVADVLPDAAAEVRP